MEDDDIIPLNKVLRNDKDSSLDEDNNLRNNRFYCLSQIDIEDNNPEGT